MIVKTVRIQCGTFVAHVRQIKSKITYEDNRGIRHERSLMDADRAPDASEEAMYDWIKHADLETVVHRFAFGQGSEILCKTEPPSSHLIAYLSSHNLAEITCPDCLHLLDDEIRADQDAREDQERLENEAEAEAQAQAEDEAQRMADYDSQMSDRYGGPDY